jgi:hypothetical protein
MDSTLNQSTLTITLSTQHLCAALRALTDALEAGSILSVQQAEWICSRSRPLMHTVWKQNTLELHAGPDLMGAVERIDPAAYRRLQDKLKAAEAAAA